MVKCGVYYMQNEVLHSSLQTVFLVSFLHTRYFSFLPVDVSLVLFVEKKISSVIIGHYRLEHLSNKIN